MDLFECLDGSRETHVSFGPPKACSRWLVLLLSRVLYNRGAWLAFAKKKCGLGVLDFAFVKADWRSRKGGWVIGLRVREEVMQIAFTFV